MIADQDDEGSESETDIMLKKKAGTYKRGRYSSESMG